MANDSNFDRNPVRGCNYGSEGGAVPDLGGAAFTDCTTIGEKHIAVLCPTNRNLKTIKL